MERAASCYPELHFNRSTLFQYEEMFGSALGGYSRAAALDPGWEEPPEREKQLLEYLKKVTELIQNKVCLRRREMIYIFQPHGGSKASAADSRFLRLLRGR